MFYEKTLNINLSYAPNKTPLNNMPIKNINKSHPQKPAENV